MKQLLFALTLPLLFSCSKVDPDVTPPIITLLGDATVTIPLGTPYIDEGATAEDDTDGDLSSDITVSNPVDINILGSYSVTYNVSDISANSATATRTVHVVPAEFSEATIKYNEYFDFETETICTGFDCEFIVDPKFDLRFPYNSDTDVHARFGGMNNTPIWH